MAGIKNLFLICLALLISIILSEMVLQVLDVGRYSLKDRVLFYSFPAFALDENKAVRYVPGASIRTVAVYGADIEYDNVIRTNSQGFIDSRDYASTPENVQDVIIIGDSFTAGSGGTRPWVEWLRELVKEKSGATQFYNLGVTGTGVRHFSRLLASFHEEIEFDEVNIMLITNDLYRGLWYPAEGKERLWFCEERDIPFLCMKKRRAVINRVDLDEDRNSILERAGRIYARKNLESDSDVGSLRGSRLYALLCDAYSAMYPKENLQEHCAHIKVHNITAYEKNGRYWSAIRELRSISEHFSDVKFRVFHVPEKGEVFLGEYLLNIKKDILTTGMEYMPLLSLCEWRRNMFHKHDSHPNDHGYMNLAGCVAGLL
jgi:hypothetical protein